MIKKSRITVNVKGLLVEKDNSGNSQVWKTLSMSWGKNIVMEFGRKVTDYAIWDSTGQESMPGELAYTVEKVPIRTRVSNCILGDAIYLDEKMKPP